jgi:hypothetical protein
MKSLTKILPILFVLIMARAYAQSNIIYEPGSFIEIQSGADICSDTVVFGGINSGKRNMCKVVSPVIMSSITASVNLNNSTLMWVTETELNNAGFDIERATVTSSGAGEWKKIAFVQGNGTTTQPAGYLYQDKKMNTGKYSYRLKQIDINGSHKCFTLESEVVIAAPNNFSMGQNYPNPSNPKSKIDYEIPIDGKVNITIFDITGREVSTIINEIKQAGYYSAEFDGTNLSSRVYFYRIIIEDSSQKFSKTLKMILVK